MTTQYPEGDQFWHWYFLFGPEYIQQHRPDILKELHAAFEAGPPMLQNNLVVRDMPRPPREAKPNLITEEKIKDLEVFLSGLPKIKED